MPQDIMKRADLGRDLGNCLQRVSAQLCISVTVLASFLTVNSLGQIEGPVHSPVQYPLFGSY